MLKKIVFKFLMATLMLSMFSGVSYANDLKDLFKQVVKLKIERHGYMLGKALNQEQLNKAISNSVDTETPDTFKFKDKNLFVVAQKTSNRVLVIYEQFEKATQQKIQNLIGDLYMQFDDPTVSAHDKVVYWAYGKKGKVSSKAFDTAKDNKTNLEILATVKFVSDINIMEKLKEPLKGQAYYIISSDPILQLFGEQKT